MGTLQVNLLLIFTSSLLQNDSGSNQLNRPLDLTQYITANNLQAGRDAAKVVDPCDMTKDTEDCGTEIPESYAGFLTVNERLDIHYFFWYFPSKNQSAPLLLHLDGEHGYSTVASSIRANGPIKPRTSAQAGGGNVPGKFERREGSWVESFSMLYIDHPVYVGYSHSTKSQSRVRPEEYGEDLFECVQQFYRLFPALLSKDLYVGGGTYGGKYIPILAIKIHNALEVGETNIPLKGIYLYSPLFNPAYQLPRSYDLYYGYGIIGKNQRKDLVKKMKRYIKNYKVGEWNMSYATTNIITDLRSVDFQHANYHYDQKRMPIGENFKDNTVATIMESDRVRSAVHAGNLNFIASNETLLVETYSQFLLGVGFELSTLLNSRDYKILIVSGDLDLLVNPSMVEEGLLAMNNWRGREKYRGAVRQQWREPDNGDFSNFYGHYTFTDSLCRVVIRGGGQDPLQDMPELSRKMMLQFIYGGCVNSE